MPTNARRPPAPAPVAMAPFVVDELAAGAEEVVVDPLVGSELALALALALEAEAEVPPAVSGVVAAPIAACWKAAKDFWAVGLTAKTIPC
jgi:hypothetical protein